MGNLRADIANFDPQLYIGHNVAFDRPMVLNEYQRLAEPENLSPIPTYCTMEKSTDLCRIPRTSGPGYPSAEKVGNQIISCTGHYLTYGNPAVPIIRDYASRYLVARIGINAVLWQLQVMGVEIKSLESCEELAGLLRKVGEKRNQLLAAGLESTVTELQEGEKNARAIACKKGIGSNLVEFARHVLAACRT